MSVTVLCPNASCGRSYPIPDPSLLGRRMRCKGCGQSFVLSTGDGAADARDSTEAAPTAAESPKRIGRFHVRSLLGRGAFGTVYLAFDPQLQREVALKVPNPGVLNNPKRVER